MVTNKIYEFEGQLNESHRIALEWIPEGSRVLEFGPATGYMTKFMKEEMHCKITGFEYSPEAAAQASEFCENITVGDIEDYSNWKDIKGTYDVIMFLDVLEHLRNPEIVLDHCRELLNPGGSLIISVPNIAHWTVRRQLLFGNFDYTEKGLLDNTHVRFFTRKTLSAMISDTGFKLEVLKYTRQLYPGDRILQRLKLNRLKKKINPLFDRYFPNTVAFQFLVKCKLK